MTTQTSALSPEPVPCGRGAAAEQAAQLLLHLAYDFVEIRWALIIASVPPGVAIVAVWIIPGH